MKGLEHLSSVYKYYTCDALKIKSDGKFYKTACAGMLDEMRILLEISSGMNFIHTFCLANIMHVLFTCPNKKEEEGV